MLVVIRKMKYKCIQCGKIFDRPKYRKAKYCSVKCSNESKKGRFWETKTCPECGKEFKSLPFRNQKYCSLKCSNESKKGKTWDIRKCLECNKEFKAIPSKNQRFCSVKCGSIYNCKRGKNVGKGRVVGKKYVIKKCKYCGKEFKSLSYKNQRFCSNICGILNRTGKGKTEIKIDGRRVKVYRHLMEKKLGRKLKTSETIHHIDMDKMNNNIDNLYLYENESLHQKGHWSIIKLIKILLEKNIIKFENGRYII